MSILKKIEQLYSRVPKIPEKYHVDINNELAQLDLNESDQKLRNSLRREKARLIKIRKITQFVEHLQSRRIDLLITEQKTRARSKFTKIDLVALSKDQAYFDSLEKERVAIVTHKRGESAKNMKREKAIDTLIALGWDRKSAERIADQEEEE